MRATRRAGTVAAGVVLLVLGVLSERLLLVLGGPPSARGCSPGIFREALEDLVILPLEESFLEFSFDLVLDDDLRTLDSSQLSAALSIGSDEHDVVFVCADRALVSIADARGLDTINPGEPRRA